MGDSEGEKGFFPFIFSLLVSRFSLFCPILVDMLGQVKNLSQIMLFFFGHTLEIDYLCTKFLSHEKHYFYYP